MRRPDGVVTQERLDDLQSKIKGHYPVPEEAYRSEDLGGEVFLELPAEALQMIAQGWMCGNGGCLAMFRAPLLTCPACNQPTGPHHIMERSRVPGSDLWDEHRKALREGPPPTSRLPKGPLDPDEWIRRIQANPEGEVVPMSKLKKRRRGA